MGWWPTTLVTRSRPDQHIAQGFREREPWVTGFLIQGRVYGGGYRADTDIRMQHLFDRVPNLGRVLELGALEGGHSLTLAERAREVVAIEGRAENIARAEWVQQCIPRDNLSLVLANLETFDLSTLGAFDWVINLGLLYHLPEPWSLLTRIARVCHGMHLWTHVAPDDQATIQRGGYFGTNYQEFGLGDPLSGMSERSFWPTRSELERMLGDSGFQRFECLAEDRRHPHGPAVEYLCWTDRPDPTSA